LLLVSNFLLDPLYVRISVNSLGQSLRPWKHGPADISLCCLLFAVHHARMVRSSPSWSPHRRTPLCGAIWPWALSPPKARRQPYWLQTRRSTLRSWTSIEVIWPFA